MTSLLWAHSQMLDHRHWGGHSSREPTLMGTPAHPLVKFTGIKTSFPGEMGHPRHRQSMLCTTWVCWEAEASSVRKRHSPVFLP